MKELCRMNSLITSPAVNLTIPPAMLIRIPDDENTTVGPRYFESMTVDGVIYPSPFAPIPELISAGWRERIFQHDILKISGKTITGNTVTSALARSAMTEI